MEPASRQRIDALWRAAERLQQRSDHANDLPPLWFFTDPARTPDPERIAERLPRGCGVVYRAFGASDAVERGRRLAAIARERGLVLLAGAEAGLARRIGAAGVHLPERLAHRALALASAHPEWLLTGAVHSRSALRRADRLPLAAVFVSPVAASASPSAGAPIGAGRLRTWIVGSRNPVFALGGVREETIADLVGTGVAGLAAVEAFTAA